ncbi:hypothetical protein A8B79_12765 [Balneola sp. EhC07]|uniref:hypothetical protein n=1 Tax=Balneola sp. EhC07 TaxID=1849360 RepID=UPI0007F43072|nr:hypothetical protein [Balneola sp. EhC07]OAN64213.1 hypothetical protein A8B79_12765 [Balneola sp. EhC07]
MSSKFYSLVLLALVWTVFASCDDALTPKDFDEQQPYVQNLVVNPSTISFDPETDGQKDTTLTLDVTVYGFNFEVDSVPYYSVFLGDDENPILQDKFLVNFSPITTFQASIPIETNTIDFETYTLLITPSLDGNNKNFAQSIIQQIGVPINPPEIIEVNNPEEVEIPSGSNVTRVLFTAKVFDPDGQENLDRVFIDFINEDGSILTPDPNILLDDGDNSSSTSSGDATASDSVYTIQFFIDSSNTPNNRTARYYALDKSGLSSDTLTTTFNIVDNE